MIEKKTRRRNMKQWLKKYNDLKYHIYKHGNIALVLICAKTLHIVINYSYILSSYK